MKGRHPNNRYSVRKKEVFAILRRLGNEARWTDLYEQFRKEHWGPTTLKQTLDRMKDEGDVKVEARMGEGGPETWYILPVKDDDVFKQFLDRPFGKLVDDIQTEMSRLEGKPEEQKAYFKQALMKLLGIFQLQHAHLFEVAMKKAGLEDACRVYTYIYDGILLENGAGILGLCLNYPQYFSEAIKEAVLRLLDALGPLAWPEA